MNLAKLILKEIIHRPLSALLALGSIILATGLLLGTMVFLRQFDLRTEAIIERENNALEAELAKLDDEIRKVTKKMGFNVLILPKNQNLNHFYAENFADKFMPQAYADKLANARNIVTIRHLLPMLQQKLEWPEQKRKILLMGVRGEMAWAHRSNKKPILQPVEKGSVTVGHELHNSLGLKAGDTITLLGRQFKVGKLQPAKGSIDDITLWIDLEEAQELLDREGQINSMLALECKCAWADLAKVRKEIQGILPDTQIIEFQGIALARAEARNAAARAGKQSIEKLKRKRLEQRKERESLFGVLVPGAILACSVWLGLLAFGNVRERRTEIGVLRALGLRTTHIFTVFLAKAAILGIAGVGIGLGLGTLIVLQLIEIPSGADPTLVLPPQRMILCIVIAAPILSMLASWLPALIASQQDPAIVLREE